MKCPKCGFEQAEGYEECLQCGIVFRKYHERVEGNGAEALSMHHQERRERWVTPLRFSEHAACPSTDPLDEDAGNPFYFAGRAVVFLGIIVLSVKLALASLESLSTSNAFLHLINLPFHEAGHIFFRPLGRFMTSLGGTLGQLLMPLVCMVSFLVKTRDGFGAAVSLWWTGENFIDIAPYVNDANMLELPLLGGNTGSSSPYGFHDWEYILSETGLVQQSHGIAVTSLAIGDALMLAACIWAGFVLYRRFMLVKGK